MLPLLPLKASLVLTCSPKIAANDPRQAKCTILRQNAEKLAKNCLQFLTTHFSFERRLTQVNFPKYEDAFCHEDAARKFRIKIPYKGVIEPGLENDNSENFQASKINHCRSEFLKVKNVSMI